MEASAKMKFRPVADNEEAGLVIRGNDKNHYDLLATYRDGKPVIMFRSYLDDKVADEKYADMTSDEVILSIVSTSDKYEFGFMDISTGRRHVIGTAPTRSLSNEVISGFTGVYIAMYASGNGKENTNPADFDWFEFIEKD